MVDGRDVRAVTGEGVARLLATIDGFELGIKDERERVLDLIEQERTHFTITPRAIGWDRALNRIKALVERGEES